MNRLSFGLGVLALLLLALPAMASAPTRVTVADSNWRVSLPSTGTYVLGTGTAGSYFDQAYAFSNHVNFTNFALGGQGNPTETFGLGIQNGNLSIAAITGISVTLNAFARGAAQVNMTFYYSGTSIPPAVGVNAFMYTATGQPYNGAFSAQYVGTIGQYSGTTNGVFAAAPGADSGHLDIAFTYSNPTQVTVYLPAGGSGGGTGTGTQPQTYTYTSTGTNGIVTVTSTSTAGGSPGGSSPTTGIVIVVIAAVVFLMFATRKQPRKEDRRKGPDSVKEKRKGL